MTEDLLRLITVPRSFLVLLSLRVFVYFDYFSRQNGEWIFQVILTVLNSGTHADSSAENNRPRLSPEENKGGKIKGKGQMQGGKEKGNKGTKKGK